MMARQSHSGDSSPKELHNQSRAKVAAEGARTMPVEKLSEETFTVEEVDRSASIWVMEEGYDQMAQAFSWTTVACFAGSSSKVSIYYSHASKELTGSEGTAFPQSTQC